MKKIIWLIGMFFLVLVVILNIVYTAHLDIDENITIKINNIFYIVGIVFISGFIYLITEKANKYLYDDNNSEKKKKIRKVIFIASLIGYIIFNVIWGIMVRPGIGGDSVHVSNLAQVFYNSEKQELLNHPTYAGIPLLQYIQAYPQQITLAYIYSFFFRIIHFDTIELLRILNIIGNIMIIVALYKITTQLTKKYKTNKTRLLILIITFISLPMLLTFIYGDIPSLAFCLFSVYFMMKYIETKKYRYSIIASICMMLAYMMRMNSLIFIIATVMYLIFNVFKDFNKEHIKEKILQILIIFIYLAVSIVPPSIIENYYFGKYNLDKNKKYPRVSFLLMAMEESRRANGWYNEEIAERALREPEKIKDEYYNRIRERINYFSKNLGYTFDFYIKKITSMWSENTYSAATANKLQENQSLKYTIEPITIYQKALLIVTCLCSLIVLIKKRKNLSLELIFLITIFIGGFAFHILWEAKSRYIIPYIVALIPVATLDLKDEKEK